MRKIEQVQATILDIPTIRPHVLSMTKMQSRQLVLVQITFADGSIGIGEATTIGGLSYGSESVESMKLTTDRYISPLLREHEYVSPAKAMQMLRRQIVGNHFALSAVEMALLDAEGKFHDVPLSVLLGGAVRDSVPVAWVLASGVLETDIEEAHAMLEQKRHNSFKVKIGKRSVRDDVAHVAAIKKAVGADVSVRVDVNQAWNRTEAKLGCALLFDAGIDLVEQPLARDDLEGMRWLREHATPPIMADESLAGMRSAWQVASAAACDIFAIKIAPSGGLLNAAYVAQIGLAAHLELYGGTLLESSVGTVAAAHLFSTFPALHWGTELFAPLLLTDQIITEPIRYEQFELQLPTGAGLGIELDSDKVAHYSITA